MQVATTAGFVSCPLPCTIVRHAALALSLGAAIAAALPYPGAAAAGFTTVTVDDTLFRMHASTMHIPSGWKFQGIMVDNAPCNGAPSVVYRAYSPDGLSEMRSAPRFDWSFSTSTMPQARNQCPPLTRTLSAAEFAKYYAGIIGATVVGPMSVDAATQQRVDGALARRHNFPFHPDVTGGVVDERLVAKNGTFRIEERLRSVVLCSSATTGPISGFTQCEAYVQLARAPQGRLDALVREIDENSLGLSRPLPEFQQRLAQWNDQRYAAFRQQGVEDMQRSNELIRSSFEQSMALQQHQHEQFMAQMQAQTDASMSRTQQAMNARSTAASDWTDYALDQQTVTGSGGTVNVSNAYGHTWSNGQGQWYQTNDPNADPNGTLPGNWTQQTVVHGDGTPR